MNEWVQAFRSMAVLITERKTTRRHVPPVQIHGPPYEVILPKKEREKSGPGQAPRCTLLCSGQRSVWNYALGPTTWEAHTGGDSTEPRMQWMQQTNCKEKGSGEDTCGLKTEVIHPPIPANCIAQA